MSQSQLNLASPARKFYFIKDLEKIIGRSRLTIRRWWTSGKFPEPIKLNGITLAWDVVSIETWCNHNK